MKSIFVLCGLLVVVGSVPEDYGDAWSNFKIAHARDYSSPHEELRRQQIFHQNLKKIEEHNARYAAGEVSWYMGVNKFADMTPEEFLEYQNSSLIPSDIPYQAKEVFKPTDLKANPTNVDHRNAFTGGVRNQGSCGSCYAFAVAGVIEAHAYRQHNLRVVLSAQNLVDCSTVDPYHNEGCNGGDTSTTMTYVKDHGIMLEEDYPYTGEDGTCKYDRNRLAPVEVTKFTFVNNTNSELMAALATVGPLAVGIDAKEWGSYQGGIFRPTKHFQFGAHYVILVGYGTTVTKEGKEDYWLIRNSEGSDWGEDGYIRVDRNLVEPYYIGLGSGDYAYPMYPTLA